MEIWQPVVRGGGRRSIRSNCVSGRSGWCWTSDVSQHNREAMPTVNQELIEFVLGDDHHRASRSQRAADHGNVSRSFGHVSTIPPCLSSAQVRSRRGDSTWQPDGHCRPLTHPSVQETQTDSLQWLSAACAGESAWRWVDVLTIAGEQESGPAVGEPLLVGVVCPSKFFGEQDE